MLDKDSKNIFEILKYDSVKSVRGHLNATLLSKFILDKSMAYIEPLREGTPKGEPIGISRIKYLASLYMMTNFPRQEIAKELKITHGVLRVWNTEDVFTDIVKKHREELADRVVVLINEMASGRNSAGINKSKKGGDYDAVERSIELADFNIYSNKVIKLIGEKYISQFRNNDISDSEISNMKFLIHTIGYLISILHRKYKFCLITDLNDIIMQRSKSLMNALSIKLRGKKQPLLLQEVIEQYVDLLIHQLKS